MVGSRSRGRAWRREGRPKSAVGDEERKRETRRAQNGTQRVTGVLFHCLATYTGYILYTTGLEAPMWYVQGGTVAVRTVGLGTRNSELGTRSSGLGVPLGSAEHGGRVARGLRGTLNVDPNPNGIVPLHREGHSGAPLADDDLSLPKATVAKMIAGTHMVLLPSCIATHLTDRVTTERCDMC